MDKKDLEKYIESGLSTYKIAEKLGCSQTNVRHFLKKFNIETRCHGPNKKSKILKTRKASLRRRIDKKCLNCEKLLYSSRQKYCSTSCQQDFQYKEYIQKWKNGEISGNTKYGLSGYIRKYIFEKFDHMCSECEWNVPNPITGKPFLEIEHIDGNSLNSAEDNLVLLCPNCHSLTPTYKALNRGNGSRIYNDRRAWSE